MDSATIQTSTKRKSLTIKEKIDILNKLKNGTKNRKLCEEYNVSSSTISTVLKNQDKLKSHYEELQVVNGDTTRTRIYGTEFELMEKAVYAWLCQRRTIGESVCGLVLKKKAKFFYSKLKREGQIPKNQREFKASAGWLSKFKKRHGLRTLCTKGEKASAATEASDKFVLELTQLLLENDYELDNVYNADETGLQYNSLPDKTLVSGNEKDIAGRKPMKDRLNIMVCANASGSHRIPLLVIGKDAKPRCFQKRQPFSMEYINQKKALMDSEVFQHWFRNIFLKTVRELKPHARIILLLDNAPSHLSAEELNAIDDKCLVKYLPPSVTSLIQPMDQGVIPAMKLYYKMGFLHDVLSHNYSSHSDFVQLVQKWTVLDCMNVLGEAWNTLTPTILRNSWKKLMPNLIPNAADITPLNNELVNLLNSVPGGSLCSGSDVTSWVEEDLNLPVFEIMSDEQLLSTYAGLRLPSPKEDEEAQDNHFKESENLDETGCKYPTKDSILNAAQCILDWTRGKMEFTNEERLTLIKVRNLALHELLPANKGVTSQ